jgi:threonine/homoserine/homoserine lactone efflux protein
VQSTSALLIAYIAAASLLTITPGLDTALVLRTAVARGVREAVLAGAGIAAGCFGWAVLVAFGLGALFAASAQAYTGLRWAGACLIAATRPVARFLAKPSVVQACDRLTGAMFVAFGLGLVLDSRRP